MSYIALVNSGAEEPSSLHADHFNTNRAYSISAYSKGAVFLNQLSYIMGQEDFDKGMLKYFNTWKYRHPNPNDFIRIMEKQSGMVLDWYLNYWIHTTKTIDYGIGRVKDNGKSTTITLERLDEVPMPIDLEVTYTNGDKETYYIPLRIMRNEKKNDRGKKLILQEDWPWTNPQYDLVIPKRRSDISEIKIDPSGRLADINNQNNTYKPDNK